MIDREDVAGEEEGAAQDQQIAPVERQIEGGRDADEKQADDRQEDAEPDPFAGIFPEIEPACQGNQHHIKRGDEAGFAGGGIDEADLLQR